MSLTTSKNTELDITSFGDIITYRGLLIPLTRLFHEGVIINTLVVSVLQLEEILNWPILKADLKRPINIDLARMKVRVKQPERMRRLS